MMRLLVYVAACMVGTPAFSQIDTVAVTPIRAGIALGASLNTHSAGFVKLPGTPNCCPEFESGFGIGPYVSIVGFLPLSASVRLDLRAGYSGRSAVLSRGEPIAVEGADGPIATTVEHSIDGTLATFDAEIRGELSVARHLWLTLGTRIGVLISKDFSQIERLGSEAPGTFENGQRTRNEFSGEIPQAAGILSSLLVGASYDLPLDASGFLRASPEINFGFAITPLNDSVDWMPHALQLGVAMTYDFAKYRKPAPIVEPEPPRLAADISFAPLVRDDSDPAPLPPRTIRVTEVVDIRHSPIIPAVFFDSASTSIAGRYNSKSTAEVDSYALVGFESEDFVSQHRDVLNVIGYRLKRSTSSIVLVPSVASDEPGSIAISRANVVRDYLVDTWGIAPSRITVERTDDPLRKASEKYADGRVENRHVGIRTVDPTVVAPISSQKNRWKFEPGSLTIVPSITADAGVQQASIDVMLNDQSVKRFDYGSGEWSAGNNVNWEAGADNIDVGKLPATLSAHLRVADRTGQTVEDETDSTLRLVSTRTVNLGRIENVGRRKRVTYQLVAVPLGSPELDPINRGLMAELASQVRPGAKITIRGYADRLGDPEYNLKLSQRRSDIASNTLRSLLPAALREQVTIDAKGGGVDNSRFTNDLPEGRVLTRGVSVVLEQEE